MSLQGAKSLANMSELWRKLGWTFMLLLAYRIGVHVPTPGVDPDAMAAFFASVAKNNLIGLFDMFSGGGLSQFSIFALGVMPYISASIIMQLLQVLSPDLKRMAKEEGGQGRKKVTQYTRYAAVAIAAVQAFGLSTLMEGKSVEGMPIVLNPGILFQFVTVITMCAGTMLIMWIGEQITSRGIGNGVSLIIFSGIVAGIPSALLKSFSLASASAESALVIGLLFIMIPVVMLGIIFVERAQRRIPIQYAKRQQGRQIVGGQSTHLPLRLNTAGVIPPIFAGSLLMFPTTLAAFSTTPWVQNVGRMFDQSGLLYNLVYVALIVFFCFFYTAIIFDPKDIAENLKKQGGFIPGIRPGDKTREYIDTVLTRITLWGAMYITAVCILPVLLKQLLNFDAFIFGGTSVLIVVGVAMDFMSQVNSYMISRQYEGLMGKTRIKGRYQ